MSSDYFSGSYSDVSGLGFNPSDGGSDFSIGSPGTLSGSGYNTDKIGTGNPGYLMAAGMFTQMFATIGAAISESNAIEARADYRQKQMQFNSQVADFQAQLTIDDGNRAADKVLTAGKQAVGEERASAGAQGIEVNAGSAQDVQVSSQTMSMMDALTIKNNAARQAFGYKVQAMSDRGQAEFTGLEARNEERSTLLTGGLGAMGKGLQGYYYGSGGTISDATRKGTY